MQFVNTKEGFPFSDAVIHSGKTLETVLTAIPQGQSKPITGGTAAEMKEIFRQLDQILARSPWIKPISVRCAFICNTSRVI